MHRMMNLDSKYDNMHKIGMIYVLKCTNNHVISSISCMLSTVRRGTYASLMENSLISSFSLLVMSIVEEIQSLNDRVDRAKSEALDA